MNNLNKEIKFKKMFAFSDEARLEEKDHTYHFTLEVEDRYYPDGVIDKVADFSVTEILNKNTYVSKAMSVAALVGSEIHEEFAKICRREPLLNNPKNWNEIQNSKNKIAIEAYKAVYNSLPQNGDFIWVEHPLVGEFTVGSSEDRVYVGGTADLVTLTPIDDIENEYVLKVYDLKTATGDLIQSNWRLQLAVYIEYYKFYLENVCGFTIKESYGYVIRPGYNKPIVIVTDQNQEQLLDAFAVKLCSSVVKETTISESEKIRINEIRELLQKVTEDEDKLKSMVRATDEQKKQLLNMLSEIVSDIFSRNPSCSLQDGEFVISPSVSTLTTSDSEYLKIKIPEAFCKTSVKTTLTLNINDIKYNCEVKNV